MADAAGRALSERADAEGGDRQQLDDGRVARHRGAEEHSARGARQARRRDQEDRREQGLHRLHGASSGFGVIYARARRFREVHGQVGRRPRRDDEGGRHRQVTRRIASRPERRPRRARASDRAARHEAQRRRLGRAAAAARRAPSSSTSSAFRTIPGQQVRPGAVSRAHRRRPRRLRRAADRQGPRGARRTAASARTGSRFAPWTRSRRHVLAFALDDRRQRLLHPAPSTGSASSRPASSISRRCSRCSACARAGSCRSRSC